VRHYEKASFYNTKFIAAIKCLIVHAHENFDSFRSNSKFVLKIIIFASYYTN